VYAVLAAITLAGLLAAGWATPWLGHVLHVELPRPSLDALLFGFLISPALWLPVLWSLARRWFAARRWPRGETRISELVDARPVRLADQAAAWLRQRTRAIVNWLSETLEQKILGRGLREVPRAILALAHGTRRYVEEGLLEGAMRLSVKALAGGQQISAQLERDQLERSLRQMAQGYLGFSRLLQRAHTGKLRHNLLWVTLTLLGVALSLLITWK
jgi:hypothetical protein